MYEVEVTELYTINYHLWAYVNGKTVFNKVYYNLVDVIDNIPALDNAQYAIEVLDEDEDEDQVFTRRYTSEKELRKSLYWDVEPTVFDYCWEREQTKFDD